jgi:hypothetical protein
LTIPTRCPTGLHGNAQRHGLRCGRSKSDLRNRPDRWRVRTGTDERDVHFQAAGKEIVALLRTAAPLGRSLRI